MDRSDAALQGSGWLRRVPGLRDRRGFAGVMLAMGAIVVIGMVGLGTEAGFWYLTKRQAQNAADAAAYAGTVRLASAQYSLGLNLTDARAQAQDAALDTAALNGFSNGTSGQTTTSVTVNVPPAGTSAYSADNAAVQVVIRRTLPRLMSGLFLASNVVITVSSTATQIKQDSACVLALGGGISMVGNATINASDCAVASEATGSSSVSMTGSTDVNATLIWTSGGCNNCNLASPTPYKQYQTPVPDPFKYLQQNSYPSSCPGGASTPPSGSGTVANSTGVLYWCSDLSLGGQQAVNLSPGTYVLYNASVSLTGGSSLACSNCSVGGAGVTMVLTGSSPTTVGTWTAAGNSSVRLNAPSTGPYAGIVLYRDALGSNQTVTLNGGQQSTLIGGVYIPTGTVSLVGNGNIDTGTQCKILVANGIQLAGTSDVYYNAGGCNVTNTALSGPLVPRMVE